MKETDLAKSVVEWLESQFWDVYQEVKIYQSVADIIALQGPLVWAIECKTGLTLGLIGQALNWRNRANLVSVAIPQRKTQHFTKARTMGNKILKDYGIGCLTVRENGEINNYQHRPKLNRKARTKDIKNFLCEEQKHFAKAGSQNKHYTPFRQTSLKVIRIVKKHPGIILKDLIDKLEYHHYASDVSAKASISHWIQTGVIKGIRYEKDGRYLRFYPDDKIKNEPSN